MEMIKWNRNVLKLVRKWWQKSIGYKISTIFYLHDWAADWQKEPYDKIWKFANDAYFKNSIHVEPLLTISMIYHKR